MNRQNTQERILQIAADLFAANGYAATGVAELSKATGLGKGALYYHIGSKEELLYKISARHVEAELAAGEALVQADLPAEQKLRQLARRHMRSIADHLPEITVFFREGHSLTGERRDALQKVRARWEDVWRQILRQGTDEGVFRIQDAITVKGVLGMFNYSYVWLRPDGLLSPEDIADRLLSVALDGLRVGKDGY